MTRFKPNIQGYFLLGLMFLLFVGIPAAFIINLMAMPTLYLGVMSQSIAATLIVLGIILILSLVIMGWFIFRFVRGNRFG